MKRTYKIMAVLMTGWCLSVINDGFFSASLPPVPVPGLTDTVFASDDDEATQEEAENPCPECPECPDPAKVVLRGLEEKRNQVEREHKAMLEEKKQLEMFEQQLDEKMENLQALKKQIEEDMALLDRKKTQRQLDEEAAYEATIGRLVKVYAGMKPKDAAAIVNTLNLEVAQEIFLRMREASASQILSFVDSEKAAKISERLAFKKQ